MKAKDITVPAEYEVRPWRGGERKARIVRVAKVTVRLFPAGSYQSYATEAWRAVEILADGKEFLWTLTQVIRPWADAEPERSAAEEHRQAGLAIQYKLEEALGSHVKSAHVDGGVSDKIHVTLNRADAEKVANILNQAPLQP